MVAWLAVREDIDVLNACIAVAVCEDEALQQFIV